MNHSYSLQTGFPDTTMTQTQRIPGMYITINAKESCTDITDCITAEEIRRAMLDDKYIGMLPELIPHGRPLTKAKIQKDLQPYWSFRDEIAIIDGIAMKCRRISACYNTRH